MSSTTRTGSTVRLRARSRSSPAALGREDRDPLRSAGSIDALAGFAELQLEPLGRRDARALLDSVLPARLDERVLERIVVETHGPLALLELPRGLTPAQLAGGFGLPSALPLSARIEESFLRRLARLAGEARLLLLLAAAEARRPRASVAGRSPAWDRNGCARRGVGRLLTLDGTVTFRHPLVRSAVYGAAEPKERRAVHRALADATDPGIEPDRRAWHRAQAVSKPDEVVASDLEHLQPERRRVVASSRISFPRARVGAHPIRHGVRSACWLPLRRHSWRARSTTHSLCSSPRKSPHSTS